MAILCRDKRFPPDSIINRKLCLQKQEGWGAGVIPRLAKDIKNELPELKGFSERNIKFMVQLFKEYESDAAIGKQAVSQLENVKRLI